MSWFRTTVSWPPDVGVHRRIRSVVSVTPSRNHRDGVFLTGRSIPVQLLIMRVLLPSYSISSYLVFCIPTVSPPSVFTTPGTRLVGPSRLLCDEPPSHSFCVATPIVGSTGTVTRDSSVWFTIVTTVVSDLLGEVIRVSSSLLVTTNPSSRRRSRSYTDPSTTSSKPTTAGLVRRGVVRYNRDNI